MKITLFKAAQDVQELMGQIDPDTGELPPEFGSAVTIAKERAVAVAACIVSESLQINAVESYAKDLFEQVKTARAKQDRWKKYLADGMASIGATEIFDESGVMLVKRYIERDESIDVFEPKLLPQDYLVEPPPPEKRPDKALIKKAIKDGFDVPGARLVKKDRLKFG